MIRKVDPMDKLLARYEVIGKKATISTELIDTKDEDGKPICRIITRNLNTGVELQSIELTREQMTRAKCRAYVLTIVERIAKTLSDSNTFTVKQPGKSFRKYVKLKNAIAFAETVGSVVRADGLLIVVSKGEES